LTCIFFIFIFIQLSEVQNNPPIPMFAASGRRQVPQGNEEPVIDPREIDKVLSETAGMLGRWAMFKKFLLESLSVCASYSPLWTCV
jgi:hypothetical protein